MVQIFTIFNDSLILMFNFNNISSLGENSTYVMDMSKSGKNGTLMSGAVINATGKYGKGLTTGISGNGYVSIPSVDISTQWTIASWFVAPVQLMHGKLYLEVPVTIRY